MGATAPAASLPYNPDLLVRPKAFQEISGLRAEDFGKRSDRKLIIPKKIDLSLRIVKKTWITSRHFRKIFDPAAEDSENNLGHDRKIAKKVRVRN